MPRILWKNLKGDAMEEFRSRFVEGVSTQIKIISVSDVDSMWNTHASIIKDAMKDSLGVAIGSAKTHTDRRESWWLCEEVQSKVTAKERYRKAKKEAKKSIAQEKEKAYEDLYRKIESKEGENDIFRIRKARERRRDLGELCIIKVEGEVVTHRILPRFDCYYSRISPTEVKTALQKVVRNKAVGPDKIPIEAWRSLGDEGDVQVCSNYMGIKLLSHTMKLWERAIERRLRRKITVSENQFGFMPGQSSIEALHLIRSIMEKYRERQRDLHLAFLDLEKAYDSVPWELIWKTLVNKGTSRRYIKVNKDMYDGVKNCVRTLIRNTGIDN
nr:retrovirus-related Pol polyprotein LINE-1 [Tanacetum cinerariifolium]